MDFQKIPQLARANYKVDIPWDYLVNYLDRVEKDYGLELNPDFQRGRVWTEEQQIAYIEFILRGGTSGRDIIFNYPGWQCHDEAENGTMQCVDGLQRLLAVWDFMHNKIPAFRCLYCDYDGHIDMVQHSFHLHIGSFRKRKEVLKWYLEMNAGGTPHTQEELDRVALLLANAKQ